MAVLSLRSSLANGNSSSRGGVGSSVVPHVLLCWPWVKQGRMSYFQVILWTLASNAMMLMICRERDYSFLSTLTYDSILFAASGGADGRETSSLTTTRAGNKNYEFALHHSLGFFDDIPADTWQKFFVEPTRTAQHYVNPIDPNAGSDNPNVWYYNNWIPVIECPHLIKLGGLVDGGKWTCDPERIPRAVQRRQQQLQQQQTNHQPAKNQNVTGWYVLHKHAHTTIYAR